jgi:hypothetical protein
MCPEEQKPQCGVCYKTYNENMKTANLSSLFKQNIRKGLRNPLNAYVGDD